MPFFIRHRSTGYWWSGVSRDGLEKWVGAPAQAIPFLYREDAERETFDLDAELHAVEVVAIDQPVSAGASV